MFLRAPAWSVLVKSCVQCMAAEQQRLQNYPARGLTKFRPASEWPRAVC